MDQMELFPRPKKEVAQHNNLIFAPFALGSMESKIFISMLERIDRFCDELPEWRIPIGEIIKFKNGYNYDELEKAAKSLTSHSVDIAPADPRKPYRKGFDYKTIVITCKHEVGSGYLKCQFHPHVKEYLLNLMGHYTRADLLVLKNFRDEKSVRFYWMLKARFFESVTVTLTVEECRQALLPKGSTAYANPNDIKKHIIEKVIKPEIDQTDCAFDFGAPVKKGNKTLAWTFARKEGALTVLEAPPIVLSDTLLTKLQVKPVSIDRKGILRINEMINTEVDGFRITEEYINFVIYRKQLEYTDGKIKKTLGGAIIDAVTKARLAKAYQDFVQKRQRVEKRVPLQDTSSTTGQNRSVARVSVVSTTTPEPLWLDELEAGYESEKGKKGGDEKTFEEYLRKLIARGMQIVDVDGRKGLLKLPLREKE